MTDSPGTQGHFWLLKLVTAATKVMLGPQVVSHSRQATQTQRRG